VWSTDENRIYDSEMPKRWKTQNVEELCSDTWFWAVEDAEFARQPAITRKIRSAVTKIARLAAYDAVTKIARLAAYDAVTKIARLAAYDAVTRTARLADHDG
jgi:hypothetical protein